MQAQNDQSLPSVRPVVEAGSTVVSVSKLAMSRPGERGPAAAPPPPPPANALLWVHRVLRGRYRIAVILFLIGATCGATVGWLKLGKRLYRSEGLLRVAYAKSAVENVTDQNGPMAMYEIFMQSQLTLMTSHRIVSAALADQAWNATGRGASPRVFRDFAENLTVESKPKTEYLRVLYTDEDPSVALAAVKSIVNAYAEAYEADQSDRERIMVLVKQRDELAAELKGLDSSISQYVEEFGTTELDPICEEAQQRALKLKGALGEIRLALGTAAPLGRPTTRAADVPASHAGPATKPAPTDLLTPVRIARVDASMRSYLDEQERLELQLERLRDHGYLDSHPRVQDARYALERAVARVRQCAEDYRDFVAATGHEPFPAAGGAAAFAVPAKPRELLLADEKNVSAMYETARAEMIDYGKKRQVLRGLVSRAEKDRQEIARKVTRAETLQTEGMLGGRLTVVSRGEAPLTPFRDTRLRMAGAGAVGGGALPLGVLLLAGVLRQQLRYSDDAQDALEPKAPLLGIVPKLDGPAGGAAKGAAQGIHSMRVMLQVGHPAGSCRTYLMTSAAAGEGKTSLAAALGLSFAASGVRTLLIDCDLVGRSLTRNVSDAKIAGLTEALAAGSMRGFFRKMEGGLHVLTVGDVGAGDACTVSRPAIERLMAEGRKAFDVILIDSGPILGSVEASVWAQVVDGVIFTIRRGQSQPLVDKAFQFLNSLGANVAGVVFNRAEAADFYRSAYRSSFGSAVAASAAVEADVTQLRRCSRFGVLVDAVMTSLPPHRTGAGAVVAAAAGTDECRRAGDAP